MVGAVYLWEQQNRFKLHAEGSITAMQKCHVRVFNLLSDSELRFKLDRLTYT